MPSPSVLSRRADSVGMGLFWRRLEEALRGSDCHGVLSIVDGKPLFVGGCSKDPDARLGYGASMHGKGHHRLGTFRTRSIALRNSPFGQQSLVHRSEIERLFGQASSFASGLNPLPAWVRRTKRVRTWVWSKLLINATRIHVKCRLAV